MITNTAGSGSLICSFKREAGNSEFADIPQGLITAAALLTTRAPRRLAPGAIARSGG
jgi:hypothetical protein